MDELTAAVRVFTGGGSWRKFKGGFESQRERAQNRPSFHLNPVTQWRQHAPKLGWPSPPPLLRSPTQEDICTLGFTYLSDQPIFLSEAFANSLGTISYSRLVKDL